MNRVVLAYSGSAATSALIPWLATERKMEVITVTVDVGETPDLTVVRERALALGAVRAHVLDAREEFVRDGVLDALRAGAFEHRAASLLVALPLPLIAKRLLQIATMESTMLVAHGSSATLQRHILAIDASIHVIDCAALGFSPDAGASTLRMMGVHVPATCSVVNAIGRVTQGNDFVLTRSPADAPPVAAIVDVTFSAGVPLRANGVDMSLLELIESIETIAGAHGVGRRSMVDGVLEAPAATVLHAAYAEIERRTLPPALVGLKHHLGRLYAEEVVAGRWFSNLREAVAAFTGLLQKRLTGTVRLRLHEGKCTIVADDPGGHATETSFAGPKAVA